MYEMAEKIRKEVDLLRFDFDPHKQVTISVGIASHCKNITSEKWTGMADEALYFAKSNGRNQIKIKK